MPPHIKINKKGEIFYYEEGTPEREPLLNEREPPLNERDPLSFDSKEELTNFLLDVPDFTIEDESGDPYWRKFSKIQVGQIIKKKEKIVKAEILEPLLEKLRKYSEESDYERGENSRSFELIYLAGTDRKIFDETHPDFEIYPQKIFESLPPLLEIKKENKDSFFFDALMYKAREIYPEEWSLTEEITQDLITEANSEQISFHVVRERASGTMNTYYLQEDFAKCLSNSSFDFYTLRDIYFKLKEANVRNFGGKKYRQKNYNFLNLFSPTFLIIAALIFIFILLIFLFSFLFISNKESNGKGEGESFRTDEGVSPQLEQWLRSP